MVLAVRQFVDLVVVIDDGSSDNTAEIAQRAGATVVRHTVMALISLLIQKEIISSLDADWARRMCKAINVVMMPLIMVFLVTFAIRFVDMIP